jgi:hypothetical protein
MVPEALRIGVPEPAEPDRWRPDADADHAPAPGSS